MPFKLTIIHHDCEKASKSSALPVKMLVDSNEYCELIHYPSSAIPEFDSESTVILYPHKDSKRVLDLSLKEMEKIKNVIAVDCTWNQTNSILNNFSN